MTGINLNNVLPDSVSVSGEHGRDVPAVSGTLYPDWSYYKNRSIWSCELFGMGKAIVVTPPLGDEPNWFWRKMQYLILGNKWVRNDK